MKTYKFTVTFEVTDDSTHDSIEENIKKEGIEKVQEGVALGFTDPNFKNLTAKIEELNKYSIDKFTIAEIEEAFIEFNSTTSLRKMIVGKLLKDPDYLRRK